MFLRRTRRVAEPAPTPSGEAKEVPPGRDGQLTAIASLSSALGRARDQDTVARTLLEACLSLLEVDFGAVALVSEDGSHAQGLQALAPGEDTAWWAEVSLDFEQEPSGIASAVFEGGPVVVYDVARSQRVNRRLADKVGGKSAVFVPLLSEESVPAVLILATTRAPKVFDGDELALLQALAAEAALALDRTRSADALAEALERERLIASIGRKVRSELDLDAVLRVAVQETGIAVGVDRCFLRLGDRPGSMPIVTEWHAEGLVPIDAVADRLPGSNLAARERRTVAVADVREEPAFQDPELGGTQTFMEIDTLAVLATPILGFDQMIGVLGLHRSEPGAWSEADILVVEAVARELGVAMHAARLLKENSERLEQQTALLKAAQVVTSELRLETVLQRLVVEVTKLLEADAADCYLFDADRSVLQCAAVYGLDSDLVEFEFPAGRDVDGRFGEPLPHRAYEGFESAISAPMTWSGERRGLLGVASRIPTGGSASSRRASSRPSPDWPRSPCATQRASSRASGRRASSAASTRSRRRSPSISLMRPRWMRLRTRPTRRWGDPLPPF